MRFPPATRIQFGLPGLSTEPDERLPWVRAPVGRMDGADWNYYWGVLMADPVPASCWIGATIVALITGSLNGGKADLVLNKHGTDLEVQRR